MNAWCLGCGAERPDALPDSPLTCRSCPSCQGPYAVHVGDQPPPVVRAPARAPGHALAAQDVQALLGKEIG